MTATTSRSAAPTVALDPADDHVPFRPRRVRFGYDGTADHWVPGDPHTTHVINVLHLLLPAGERWFGQVYRKALPLIDDPDLVRDVKAFIGQEATHARAHDHVLDLLSDRGIDHSWFTNQVERGFAMAKTREAPEWLPGPLRRAIDRRYLRGQLAVVAGIEHFTAVMGWWILTSYALDEAGADPSMMALLRWHGAEEVEHRSVAFDAYEAMGGGYMRRCLAMLVTCIGLFSLLIAGTDHLLRHDRSVPRRQRRASVIRFHRAGRAGLLPTTSLLLQAIPRYLDPGYHPSGEARTEVATAYLATAPGVDHR